MANVEFLRAPFYVSSVGHPELFEHLASIPERFRAERIRYLCDLGRTFENLKTCIDGSSAGRCSDKQNDERLHVNLIVHRPIYPELVDYLSEIGRGRNEAIRGLASKGLLVASGGVSMNQCQPSQDIVVSMDDKSKEPIPSKPVKPFWNKRGGANVRDSMLQVFDS